MKKALCVLKVIGQWVLDMMILLSITGGIIVTLGFLHGLLFDHVIRPLFHTKEFGPAEMIITMVLVFGLIGVTAGIAEVLSGEFCCESKPKKKKAVKKPVAKKKAKPKTVEQFMRPLRPSDELGAIVGYKPLPRTQAIKKLWAFIQKHKLQDPKNLRMINAKNHYLLKAVFKKDVVSMFEMTKLVSKHLSEVK